MSETTDLKDAALAAVKAQGTKPAGKPEPRTAKKPMSEETKEKLRQGQLARIAAQQARTPAPPVPLPPPPRSEPRPRVGAPAPARLQPVDAALAEATRIARELVADEEADRNLRMEMLQKGLDPSRIPPSPYRLQMRRIHGDQTQLVYSDGSPIPVPPGVIPRWVRTVDAANRPVDTRVGEFIQYGAEVVQDKVTGEPVSQWQHLLLFVPVRGYAQRTHAHMPDGALAGKQAADRVEEYAAYANRLNRARGDGAAVRVRREAEDGEEVEQTVQHLPSVRTPGEAQVWTP